MAKQKKIIKICGITNYLDAINSFQLGADYIGFVLHPNSDRFCNLQKLNSILSNILDKKKVFVFGYDSIEYIQFVFEQYRDSKTFLQIPVEHKNFSTIVKDIEPQFVFPVISVDRFLSNDILLPLDSFPYLILDSPPKNNSKIPGGTGKTFDWDYIPKQINKKFLLAGGLNVNNIQKAMDSTNASGFDVASGVEKKPGMKDMFKIKKFIQIVKKEN